MNKNLPNNDIFVDYKKILNIFVNNIQNIANGNLICVFITGSFARGEATEKSDLDVWCVFNDLDTDTLNKIGEISRNFPVNYNDLELNSQCLTLEEFNSGYFSKFLAYPIIYLEGILLFGEDITTKPLKNKEIEKIMKEFLVEILMSIRHYISVDEPAEKLTHQKVKTWILKPLMFVLRLERYLCRNQYPLTINDLLSAYDVPPIPILYFMDKEKWENDITNFKNKTLFLLHEIVCKIIKECERKKWS
jgi:predicted nucleotidyltransferase